MDAPNGQTDVNENLIQNLNDLLVTLELPITVNTPYDLTPSLLLAILESILRDRLPISSTTRESRTPAAKVEAMKVFLGVLEDDVLQTDIGLSEIDPRRLAAGERDEVVFVGETLCWLGGRREQMHHDYTSQPDNPEVCSSGGSRTSSNVDTFFSRYDASETTVTTLDHESAAPIPSTPTIIPQCIHEFDVSSFSFDTQSAENGLCDCSLNPYGDSKPEDTSHDYTPSPSVRYHGLIEPVKGDIEEFELWQERIQLRSAGKTPKRMTLRHSGTTLHNPTRHTSPMQYTLSLLNERAQLLEGLAKLKVANAQDA